MFLWEHLKPIISIFKSTIIVINCSSHAAQQSFWTYSSQMKSCILWLPTNSTVSFMFSVSTGKQNHTLTNHLIPCSLHVTCQRGSCMFVRNRMTSFYRLKSTDVTLHEPYYLSLFICRQTRTDSIYLWLWLEFRKWRGVGALKVSWLYFYIYAP